MLETFRAFIAINLEISAVRRVVALQRSLRSSTEALDKVSWVSPTNLRISLLSFGRIDKALSPAIADALRKILRNTPSMRVQFLGLDAYPGAPHARILYLGARESSGALEDLVSRSREVVRSLGIKADPRPFQPCLILGRSQEPMDVTRWFASLGRSDLIEAQATECVLYRGEVANAGAEFTALVRLPLATPPNRSQRPRGSRHPSQRPKARSQPPPSVKGMRMDAIPPPPKVPGNLNSSKDNEREPESGDS